MPPRQRRRLSEDAKEVQKSDDAAESSSSDDLQTPKQALRGRYGGPLKSIFNALVDMIDGSELPLFKSHFSRASMTDFVHWLLDVKEAQEASVEDDEEEGDSSESFVDEESEESEESEEEDDEEESLAESTADDEE